MYLVRVPINPSTLMPKSSIVHEYNGGQVYMGSDSKKSPRTRHKFSFSDQTKPKEFWVAPTVAPSSAGVSNDDILNSMTKQVHPGLTSEQFPEVGYATPSVNHNQDSMVRNTPLPTTRRNGGSAK